MIQQTIWNTFWSWAGRVPLRQKIIGIIVAPLLILGFTIAWWVSNQLGGWLSYLLSEARVAQAMSVGMRSVTIITIFSAVAGLGIGWFLTWMLTRPILDMTQVARRIENGDFSVRAPVWANDEIGELGCAFNAMIGSLENSQQELEQSNQQLKHRNQELAVLYELADMANNPYNIQQISERGLDRTLENIGGQAGLILLFSDNESIIVASHNLPQIFLDKASIASSHFSIPNHLLETNDPLIVDTNGHHQTISDSLNGLSQLSQELGYNAMTIVKITASKKLLGIMIVLCREIENILPKNCQLMSGICNQLGMTLQNNQLWEELKQKEQLLKQLLTKVVSVQEEERQRISRELHDETGQGLTSLLVQLKILDRYTNLDDVKTGVEDARRIAVSTLQEVKRLAADLRPAALDDLGLISALESYIYEYAKKTMLDVDFQTHQLDDVRLPHNVEITLYRVIQEALTNIARHSQATHVVIDAKRENNIIQTTVSDNGCGFNVQDMLKSGDRGLGLLGMQERIQLLGGQFVLKSQPDKGTQVHIELSVSDQLL